MTIETIERRTAPRPNADRRTAPRTFEANYSLDAVDTIELAAGLLPDDLQVAGPQFSCYSVSGTSEASNLGRTIELSVFHEAFGNTEEQMNEEYGPYEAASRFFIEVDRDVLQSSGALRVMPNNPAGLKTLNDIQGGPLNISLERFLNEHKVENLDEVWDIGSVVVPKEYRKFDQQLVSTMLYRGMYVAARAAKIKHFVSVIDKKVQSNFNTLGMPFVPIAGSQPFEYMDSEHSTAVYGYVDDFVPSIEKKYQETVAKKPRLAQAIATHVLRLTTGEGVDDALMFSH